MRFADDREHRVDAARVEIRGYRSIGTIRNTSPGNQGINASSRIRTSHNRLRHCGDTAGDCSCERHDHDARIGLFDDSGDAGRGFAVDGLSVNPPFTSDAHVRRPRSVRQSRRCCDKLDAGFDGRVREGEQSRSGSATGTGSGNCSDRTSQIALDNLREPPECVIELPDHRRGRALLRAEYRGCAGRPGQRIGDIGGDADHRIRESRVQMGGVDMVESRERRAARFQIPPIRIKQSGAKRLGDTGAAIVGRTAAKRNDDRAHPIIQRMPNQLARAERTGAQRVARLLVYVVQAACTRHLHHGDTPGFGSHRARCMIDAVRTAVMRTALMRAAPNALDTPDILRIPVSRRIQQPVLRADRPHKRVVYHRAATPSTYRSQQRIQRALSPIRHRRNIATRRRASRHHPACDRMTHRHGIK